MYRRTYRYFANRLCRVATGHRPAKKPARGHFERSGRFCDFTALRIYESIDLACDCVILLVRKTRHFQVDALRPILSCHVRARASKLIDAIMMRREWQSAKVINSYIVKRKISSPSRISRCVFFAGRRPFAAQPRRAPMYRWEQPDVEEKPNME